MSKSHRDKIRGRYKARDKLLDKERDKLIKELRKKGYGISDSIRFAFTQIPSAWKELKATDQIQVHRGYSKSPSWWNKLFNNAPKKAKTRDMLKQIDLSTDCDDMVFPDDNKPHLYYW